MGKRAGSESKNGRESAKKTRKSGGGDDAVLVRAERLIRQSHYSAARETLEPLMPGRSGQQLAELYRLVSLSLYEERRYEEALDWITRALSIAPSDPLFLWGKACCLHMLKQLGPAIDLWDDLLKAGVHGIRARRPMSRRAAESFLNDCRYKIARAYHEFPDLPRAVAYYRRFLSGLKPGLTGQPSRRTVLARLRYAEAELELWYAEQHLKRLLRREAQATTVE